MSDELKAVAKNMSKLAEDLSRYKGRRVSYALTVFRDVGAQGDIVQLKVKDFTPNVATITKALSELKPASGAPYFHEPVDRGVAEAIEKLNWSKNNRVTRWIMLLTDAPPLDVNFVDKDSTGAQRYYDTQQLIRMANDKSIAVNAILCRSRAKEQASYQATLPDTKRFLNQITSKTSGLMLDLSDDNVVRAIMESAQKPVIKHSQIGIVREPELILIRQQAEQVKSRFANSQRRKFAVLPFMPVDQLSFDSSRREVQLATELRSSLRQLTHVYVANPRIVDRTYRIVRRKGLRGNQLIRAIGAQLRVDYVVAGSMRNNLGVTQWESAIHEVKTGRIVGQTIRKVSKPEEELELAGRMVVGLLSNTADPVLVAAYESRGPITRVANTTLTRSQLLEAMDLLERSLEYQSDSAIGLELNEKAAKRLAEFIEGADGSRQILAHYLLANSYKNQSQYHAAKGDAKQAKKLALRVSIHLKLAYTERRESKPEDKHLEKEIDAEYQLLIKKNFKQAEKLYTELSAVNESSPLHYAARAKWMLLGMYGGDWNTPRSIQDKAKERKLVREILALWPNSPEAKFLKSQVRFQEGESRIAFRPLANGKLAEAIAAGVADQVQQNN